MGICEAEDSREHPQWCDDIAIESDNGHNEIDRELTALNRDKGGKREI